MTDDRAKAAGCTPVFERVFAEFKARYISDRTNDLKAFEDFKEGLDDKTKLQATEYERRLTAYPTIKDFNELKEKVTVEFSIEMGKGKALLYAISIVSLLIAAGAGILAYVK